MMNQEAGTDRHDSSVSFGGLGLGKSLLRALEHEGYTEPTSIQAQAIAPALAGQDVLGTAKTGTGKTAAFLLPLLSRIDTRSRGGIQALVLSPTRELAAQISDRASAYGRHLGLRHALVYGGVSQHKQERMLRQRPSLLVATPGRLLDLMNQNIVRLDQVKTLVLDEADRMLDMGFLPDLRRIVAEVPAKRQTLMFSATMPSNIKQLANGILRDPVRVSADALDEAPAVVEQSLYFVSHHEKRSMVLRFLREDSMQRALIFTRTKRGADRLAQQLEGDGITATAIHGNKSQNARERALKGFRAGKTPVLVATDVAARGIDVKDISHVINYELPDTGENYVHRIGRTGRAGATGKAISLCTPAERGQLYDIERTLASRIPVIGADGKPAPSAQQRPASRPANGRRRAGGGGGMRRRRSRGRLSA